MQIITPKEYAKKVNQTEQNITRKIRLYMKYNIDNKEKAKKYAAKHFPMLKDVLKLSGNRKVLVLRNRVA